MAQRPTRAPGRDQCRGHPRARSARRGTGDRPAVPTQARPPDCRGPRRDPRKSPDARSRPGAGTGDPGCHRAGAQRSLGQDRRHRKSVSISTPIRAARGTQLSARGWQQEAALRMLCNNLDPEVAERPEDLVVYGGTGKAARDWPSFHRIVAALKRLKDDETLLVQSGKPVGIFRTHEYAPRVLIANSLLVPHWATWEHFWELERLGLMMYGQMTAGSWIYIGTQGILQGTYETFNAVAAKRFGGSLKGRVVLTSGLGGMGGAQPLAVTMNGGVALCIEVDPSRIARRLENGYLDEPAASLDDALHRAEGARARGEAVSIGVCANAADTHPELVRRGFAA